MIASHLYDYTTGDDLGEATEEQIEAAAESMSDAGTFDIDADGHVCVSHTNGRRMGFIPAGGVRTVYVI